MIDIFSAPFMALRLPTVTLYVARERRCNPTFSFDKRLYEDVFFVDKDQRAQAKSILVYLVVETITILTKESFCTTETGEKNSDAEK